MSRDYFDILWDTNSSLMESKVKKKSLRFISTVTNLNKRSTFYTPQRSFSLLLLDSEVLLNLDGGKIKQQFLIIGWRWAREHFIISWVSSLSKAERRACRSSFRLLGCIRQYKRYLFKLWEELKIKNIQINRKKSNWRNHWKTSNWWKFRF